jgi:hypothetical protein
VPILDAQIWGTGLQGGARAAVLLNRHFDEALGYDNSTITLHWHHLGWEVDMPVRRGCRSPLRWKSVRFRHQPCNQMHCLCQVSASTLLASGLLLVSAPAIERRVSAGRHSMKVDAQWHALLYNACTEHQRSAASELWYMHAPVQQATVRDLYAKKDLGLFTHNFTAVIPYHGVLALKLTPSKYVSNFDDWRPWDCGIETDTGEHGVWACFSARPCSPSLSFSFSHVQHLKHATQLAVLCAAALLLWPACIFQACTCALLASLPPPPGKSLRRAALACNLEQWCDGIAACLAPAGHTALDKPMLYGVVPIDATMAAALGAVIAVLVLGLAAVITVWRISITRNRKAYKMWNEEVCFPEQCFL